MTYKIKGHTVTMTLSAAEVAKVIESLELADPEGELLEAFRQFRKEVFA